MAIDPALRKYLIKLDERENPRPMTTPSKQPPLWMPHGSVRAIMALGIVGVVMGRVAFGLPVDDGILALAGAAAGGYGLMRRQQETEK